MQYNRVVDLKLFNLLFSIFCCIMHKETNRGMLKECFLYEYGTYITIYNK